MSGRVGLAIATIASLMLAAAPAGAQATPPAAGEQLPRAGYAALVWNDSRCTVSIGDQAAPVRPGNDTLLFLAPMGTAAGATPVREIRVDGRPAAQIAGDAHVEVNVRASCDVTARAMTRATLAAYADASARHLEFMQSEARSATRLSAVLSALAFGAAAAFAGDADGSPIKVGLSAGAGLLFLGIAVFGDDFGDDNRRALALHRRILAELGRPE